MKMDLSAGGLYAITPAAISDAEILLARVGAVLEGGARMLQFRDKHRPAEERLLVARRLSELCRRQRALFLVNDDVELALAAGADGVHLGQSDGDVLQARARLGLRAVIGVTCHNSLALALRAQEMGADYVAFGRFFPSTTKPSAPPASRETLRAAGMELSIPIVAIGGITAHNGASLLEAGAHWLAAIGALFDAPDPWEAARAFAPLFPPARSAR
jgi:thiamine-phosphate pyrophosphorylase